MKNKKGSWLIRIGLLLIVAALGLVIYNIQDEKRAKKSVEQAVTRLEKVVEEAPERKKEEIPDYILNPDMEMPVKKIDGQDYIATLEILSLGLKLPVISEWSYPRLKIAPCRYKGSAYTDDLIIAAHNYPSHFGNLKNLREGDQIVLTDMAGNRFTYETAELETVMPTDISQMESGEWDLTLFTCTIGGQSRVTVRCIRIPDPMAE